MTERPGSSAVRAFGDLGGARKVECSNHSPASIEARVTWRQGDSIESIEREVILQCLNYYHGRRDMTAQALGISVRTLRNKLNQYREDGESY